MWQISNVEFILLALIQEQPKITGYQLNVLIETRGYRDWAAIGTTSIYVGLKKLKARGAVTAATDRYKKGRGPKGVQFTLTATGAQLLHAEVQQGLSSAQAHGEQLMLAISALPILTPAEAHAALQQRLVELQQDAARVQAIYTRQQTVLPLPGDLLFRYSLAALNHEITFTQTMLMSLPGE